MKKRTRDARKVLSIRIPWRFTRGLNLVFIITYSVESLSTGSACATRPCRSVIRAPLYAHTCMHLYALRFLLIRPARSRPNIFTLYAGMHYEHLSIFVIATRVSIIRTFPQMVVPMFGKSKIGGEKKSCFLWRDGYTCVNDAQINLHCLINNNISARNYFIILFVPLNYEGWRIFVEYLFKKIISIYIFCEIESYFNRWIFNYILFS